MEHQVCSSPHEHVGCLWKHKSILVNECCTYLGMREQALAARQGRTLYLRERVIDRSHGSFCPLSLHLLIHLRLDYYLNQAMETQQFLFHVALHERVPQHFCDCFVQLEWISSNRHQGGAEIRSPFDEDLFRDGIRIKESAQSQQVGSSVIRLFDPLKGE